MMVLNTEDLLLLVCFPIIGLLFSFWLQAQTVRKILVIFACLSLLPFSGYDFFIGWLYELNLSILLSCFYFFLIRLEQKKWLRITYSIILSIVIFLPLAFNAFVDAFAGHQYVEKSWNKGNYSIRYIRDQGFAGKPAFYYELIHRPLNGLFEKRISGHGKTTDDCHIIFKEVNREFNLCQ